MQLEYPLRRETHNNLVLTKEKVAIAYYRIKSETVMLTDREKKEKTKRKVARAIKRLSKNKGVEITLSPVNTDIRGKMGALRSIIDKNNYKVGVDKLKKTVVALEKEMGMVYEYCWLIGVPLSKAEIAVDFKEGILQRADSFSEKVVNGLGLEVELDEGWGDKYKEQENEVFQNLSELLVERLTEDELYYYQAYQFLKNIPHERKDVLTCQSVDNLMDAKIKPLFGGGMKFSSEYGESYVDALPIGDMGVFLDGNHLLEIVQKMPFPVEVKIGGLFSERNGQLGLTGRSSRAKTRTKNIMQEARIAGSKQKRKIMEGQLSLDDLDQQIDDGNDILDWNAYLIVTGSTKKQMKARKKYLLNRFDSFGVPLWKATFDTPYIFQSTLFGNFIRNKSMKWQHTSTVDSFAELNFFTSLRSGTNLGFYFGRVDSTLEEKEDRESIIASSKNLIYLNMLLSNKQGIKGKKTNNPHIALTGDTGNGKSVVAKKLFMESALLKDKVLYIDPKKEMRSQFMRTINDPEYRKKNPLDVEFIESFNFVTLDVRNKKNKGVLDPIVLFDSTEAISTAKAMLTNIYEGQWDLKQKTAINEAISKVVGQREKGQQVGFWHVIDEFKQDKNENVRDMGRFLASTIKDSILELSFSRGEVVGLSFDKKVTILEIQDLDLPKEKGEVLDENKRLSVTLMFALGMFCSKFGSRDPKEETIVFFDESWIFQSSSEGKGILKSMKRVGRSQNNFLVLITQSVEDLDDNEDGTGFGMVICFDEVNNREGILQHLNLPINETNLKWVSNMVQGQCLFKDMFGQINRVVVHVLFDEWLKLFETVDDTDASRMENQFVA
ncbi:ATP-binding protein [Enterococcus termitis]|uniref:Conjugal transfer protein n=1 Tax=Enterococcus termitis TaxID=332950 RepID=A0A1E5GVP1_9ENTE|nr:ATP-binding protein [Enterococcus termitis]OEG16784.1 conjugal transfer protein [Enterococcus termitis]OJG99493.1 conjugal transfer protein [Enterococcus termitis]